MEKDMNCKLDPRNLTHHKQHKRTHVVHLFILLKTKDKKENLNK
jgi:hypothetical protein